RKTADRRSSFLVEYGSPGQGAIDRLPNPTPGAAEIIGRGITRNARRSQRASATIRTNESVLHALEIWVFVRCRLRSLRLGCDLRRGLRALLFRRIFLCSYGNRKTEADDNKDGHQTCLRNS